MKAKHFFTISLTILFSSMVLSCDVLQQVVTTLPAENSSVLSDGEIQNGLTEALKIGLENAVKSASATDGFLKNQDIFIPFPPEVEKVKKMALDLHLDAQVAQFEETLNRAAEKASAQVKPIFLDALMEMTFADARNILQGGDNAATNYFKQKTEKRLQEICYPEIEKVTSQVQLTKYWTPVVSVYNKACFLTGAPEVNPDLNSYVTQRTIDGLFLLIGNEEKQIRENPQKRVTEILQKVFGSL